MTDALLQSSILLTLSLLICLVIRRSSAAKRNALLFYSVLGIPLLFILTAVLPTQRIPYSETLVSSLSKKTTFIRTTEFAPPVTTQSDIHSPSLKTHPTTPANEPLPNPAQSSSPSAISWIINIWLIGIALLWLRLLVGIISLARLTTLPTVPALQHALNDESKRLGLKKTPRLLLLNEQTMPKTWWLGRHILALPKTSSSWSPQKLSHVIRHELAHIQSRDCLCAWIAEISLALLWFHPLAWILKRSLHATREAACDNHLAIASEQNPGAAESYARHLLEIVATHSHNSHRSSLALAMARNHSGIHQRLEAILDDHQDRRPVPPRSRYLTLPLWLACIGSLASLSACRSIPPAAPSKPTAPTSGTHVKISTRIVEVGDPALLKKLFNIHSNDPQFTAVIPAARATENLQKLRASSADITTMPGIVTRPGKRGKFDLVREFIYPSEYTPPQFPNAKSLPAEVGANFPVTPASPKSFVTRDLGLTCEVLPTLLAQGAINLDVAIDHTHFLGFVNYGSPIKAPATNFLGYPVEIVITENRIEMPVFRNHKFELSLPVPPGHLIALIGFSLEGDPKLNEHMDRPENGQHPDLSISKSTLYLIQPEFSDTPKKSKNCPT